MIDKILNRLSKTKENFKESITKYQNALTNSNLKHKLKYSNHQNSQKKKPTRQEKRSTSTHPTDSQ